MGNIIAKSQNYLLTVPNKNPEENDISVELKIGFHCMTNENHVREIEDEFQKFRETVSSILEKISTNSI